MSNGKVPNPSKHVRVRMYDVGFGDGFVIFIPDKKDFRTLVLDCGSIKSGTLGGIDKVARRMVADIEAETHRRRVDVVVASHRHEDHVSGFQSEVWATVEVGEVWLPWTENPADPKAVEILQKQASLAIALTSGRPRRLAPGVAELSLNALSNAKAMDTLHRGFKSRDVADPRYLPEPERAKATFKTDRLPGVLVRVLGPSRLDSVIRDMDPPSGESYLARLALLAGKDGDDGIAPFTRRRQVDRGTYADFGATPLDRKLEKRAADAGEIDASILAAALDASVNGTSLMLMLDVGNVRLLLPGDAQWGTWEAALGDPEWGPLFTGATFYKIGHHGSHNATPKRFVEGPMKNAIPAMASVNPTAKWQGIPLKALLDRMTSLKKVSVARSDRPNEASKTVFRRAPDSAWLETWLAL